MSVYEFLSLVLGFANVVSLIFLAVQIRLTKKQKEDSHEELRRIKTVEIVNNWNDSLKKETRLAEKIVESLDKQKCIDLYDSRAFQVPEKTHNMICQMCSRYKTDCEDCKPDKNGNYTVDGLQLTELRGNVTSYLNSLEIVAMAWQQGIVDREEIELQFSYLYNPSKKSALSYYRQVAGGGNSYPELNQFYQKIKANNTKKSSKKSEQK